TGTTTFFTSTSSGSSSSDYVMPKKNQPLLIEMTSRRRAHGMEISPLCPGMPILIIFICRDDGIWCRRDAIGRLYPVNACGDRCSKPNTSSGKYNDQRRPDEVSSHVWWEMMNKEERRQWWGDHPEVRLADDSLPSIRCHPLGIEALIDDVPPVTLMSCNVC
ncbi:MAG: hypothetical protein ACKPKO_51845, partial [Candidatus Fonsibacter sp.]